MNASIQFPSLLALFGRGRGEQHYDVHNGMLDSEVDEDGSSDLGRTFGLDGRDGRSTVDAALEWAQAMLADTREQSVDSSFRLSLRIDNGTVASPALGDKLVRIDDLVLEARSYRGGAKLDLREGRIRGPGIEGESSVKLEAWFSLGPGGRDELTFANAEIGPLPLEVLRALGVLSRVEEPQAAMPEVLPRLNLFDELSPALTALGRTYIEQGAQLALTFGNQESQPGWLEDSGQPVPFDLQLRGAEGDALRVAGQAMPSQAGPGRTVLVQGGGALGEVSFEMTIDGDVVAGALDALCPPEVQCVARPEDGRWRGIVRSFSVPLPRSLFELGASPAGDPLALAPILRRTEIQGMSIGGAADAPARVRLQPRGAVDPGAFDVVELTHRATTIELLPPFGGQLQSNWASSQGVLSSFKVELPGRPIQTANLSAGKVDLSLGPVPRSFLRGAIDAPDTVMDVLPYRLQRVDVRGLPLRLFFGERAEIDLEVEVQTEPGELLKGRLVGDEFHCPFTRFDLEMDDAAAADVLLYLMPWIAEIRPVEDQGSARFELRTFSFRFEDGQAGQESGSMRLELDPVMVRLEPALVARLGGVDAGRDEGWIEWSPKGLELQLDRRNITYLAMELPLFDGDTAELTGRSSNGAYNLKARLPASYISGDPDDTTRVTAQINLFDPELGPEIGLSRGDMDLDDFSQLLLLLQERLKGKMLEDKKR